VSGIYSTDLEDFDKQYVYLDIRHLQKIMARGLEVQVLVSDTCYGDRVMVEATGFGGGRKTFFWSNGMLGAGPHAICPAEQTELNVILKDDLSTVPDTAFLIFKPGEQGLCGCIGLYSETRTSGGSYDRYISGYELTLNEFKDMAAVKDKVESEIGPFLYCSDIIERTPEIFSWLELLDVNIYIIIILMVGVAVVNMSSALIITIIERSKMIGVLKAMGADNASVRRIFIRHATRLIGVGLILGNVLGLGLALLQLKFGIIELQAENYYLSEVPILIHWQDIVLIDLGTLSVCLLAMTIPSLLITRISPVRAIRFD
jgi:ABC-type lipoprotein release transport system permease subunit